MADNKSAKPNAKDKSVNKKPVPGKQPLPPPPAAKGPPVTTSFLPGNDANNNSNNIITIHDDDDGDEEDGAVVDLLEKHEKELLAVASDLVAETSHYDVELQHLTIKLEAASRRLLQLERRFPTLVLWRVDNFLEAFREARNNGGLVVSPPYYVSRQGYRLSMTISLYGDGPARGEFMSLYVSICQGEFDGCLAWPFTLRVHVSILDQTEDEAPRRNFTRTIVPRVTKSNRPYLERPRRDRNPRFGFEKFASIDEFLHCGRHYVRNDAIFVKLEVPCEDLSTA